MRKLGLIGGMSWVSTRGYYEQINTIVQKRLGTRSSAPMVIESLDFSTLYQMHSDRDWDGAASILIETARRIEQAGADMLVICANSMHRMYREVAAEIAIPILHIAECVGERMERDGVKTAALLGPRNVMTESFYRRRLVARGVDLLPPDMDTVERIDEIIYNELIVGKATRQAERFLKTVITERAQEGAQAIVLASTELGMVVDVRANVLPIYDSLQIHAEDAANWALADA